MFINVGKFAKENPSYPKTMKKAFRDNIECICCGIETKWVQLALLYLRSDSTTVPLADANFSGPRDEKRLLDSTFFELIEKR